MWVWIVLSLAGIVGLGVIALLLARVLPHLDTARRNMQDAQARADIAGIERALAAYAQGNGAYPTALEILVVPDAAGQRFLPRQAMPKDPWGRDYRYEPPVEGGHARPYVWSLGEDGVAGSEDDLLSAAMFADR